MQVKIVYLNKKKTTIQYNFDMPGKYCPDIFSNYRVAGILELVKIFLS